MKTFSQLKNSTKKDIIIQGLMKSNGVYFIVAAPKVGKSLFALQLAYSIVYGKQFLGYEILKPSPVLYVTTEVDGSQIWERSENLNIEFDEENFGAIDRSVCPSMNLNDMELEIKDFFEKHNGGILILDMLKEIDFGISFDLNSYQDVSQKIMPIIRKYIDKYNITIIIVHHANKVGKTLGSTGLDACVDGIIRLYESTYDKNSVKVQIDNRDFPYTEFNISRGEHGDFSISPSDFVDEDNKEYKMLTKYIVSRKSFDTTIGELLEDPKLVMSPTQLGKMIHSKRASLAKDGITFTYKRTSEGRMYHFEYKEPDFAEND